MSEQTEMNERKITIAWGGEAQRTTEYVFSSAELLDAFLWGVSESNGWMDYEVVSGDDEERPEAITPFTIRSVDNEEGEVLYPSELFLGPTPP
jgi:hypothetical protein